VIESIFIFLAVIITLVAIGQSKFSFFSIIVLLLLLPISGALTFAFEGRASFDSAYGLAYSLVALILGYWFVSSLNYWRQPSKQNLEKIQNSEKPGESSIGELELWIVSAIVAIGTLWHFAVGGIPLFSSEVELLRFDFTSSGLFGIPGRLYLFGTKISWILISAYLSNRGEAWSKSLLWRFSSAILLISTLLSGFKGGLVVNVLMMVCTFFLFSNSKETLFSVVRKFWWVFLIGLANFLLVGTTYASYQLKDRSLISQLADRINTGSAEAGVLALEGRVEQVHGNWIAVDWNYFVSKYSGNGTSGLFTLEQSVSASINGLPLDSGYFISPVTIGAYPYLVIAFNIWVALFGMFAFGGLMGYLQRVRPSGEYSKSMAAIALVIITEFLTKGVFVYTILNYTAVTLLIFLIVALSPIFRSRARNKVSLQPRLASLENSQSD
jgi:hypothetical protein